MTRVRAAIVFTGFVIGCLLAAGLWALGIWQLAYGSVGLGTALVLLGGLSFVALMAIKYRDPGSGVEGMINVIFEFFSTPR